MLEIFVAIVLICFFGLFVALSFPMKEDVAKFNEPRQTQRTE